MKGRERFLTAINNQKPDRMPCQVHSWMRYYLDTYLNGVDQYAAYEFFGMDPVIYVGPMYVYDDKDRAAWNEKVIDLGLDGDGNKIWKQTIETPEGTLTQTKAGNRYTTWVTEYLIKNEKDFDIFNKYLPLPVSVDWTPVLDAKRKIGENGIVRYGFFDFGQGSPWQSFVTMYNIEQAIMDCFDKPDWIHYVLRSLLDKKLEVIEKAGKIELDLVETGGGAGSSTVISPDLHREFCLPYDRIQHYALHEAGTRIVYHLCGGLMPLLEIVAENGADGLETMTPPEMGGDCDLDLATKRVGDKLFFIGGFDQNKGFEKGKPEEVKKMVHELHGKCPNGGYICSPSDHFFFGNPENIKAFVEAARECVY